MLMAMSVGGISMPAEIMNNIVAIRSRHAVTIH